MEAAERKKIALAIKTASKLINRWIQHVNEKERSSGSTVIAPEFLFFLLIPRLEL